MKKSVAVVAHSGRTFAGGLSELRAVLASAGCKKPLWYEVRKSAKAHKAIRRAVKKGARLIFVWGGDGMVQHCVDALADSKKVEVAIVPAGTANLLAHNLGIPQDIARAVHIGLHGRRRKMDVGTMNGERFTVMAGTGFDATMIGGVDRPAKKRLGRMAYLRSAAKAMKVRRFPVTIRVDGAAWWKGMASTVLVGNVGKVMGGVTLFPGASPSDGFLDVGVVTASTRWQWLRVFSRLAAGHLERSPFIERTRGKRITVELDRKRPYEIDGSVRPAKKRLEVRLEADAITLCLPAVRAATRPKKPRQPVTPARIAPRPTAVPIAPGAVPVEPQPNGTGPRTTPDRP